MLEPQRNPQRLSTPDEADHLEVGRQTRALIIRMCARIARRSGTWRRRKTKSATLRADLPIPK